MLQGSNDLVKWHNIKEDETYNWKYVRVVATTTSGQKYFIYQVKDFGLMEVDVI